jgi:hypothetical protein
MKDGKKFFHLLRAWILARTCWTSTRCRPIAKNRQCELKTKRILICSNLTAYKKLFKWGGIVWKWKISLRTMMTEVETRKPRGKRQHLQRIILICHNKIISSIVSTFLAHYFLWTSQAALDWSQYIFLRNVSQEWIRHSDIDLWQLTWKRSGS